MNITTTASSVVPPERRWFPPVGWQALRGTFLWLLLVLATACTLAVRQRRPLFALH